MRLFRRSLIALGVAAMLPTVLFLAVGLFLFLRTERERIEEDALARSRIVMTLIDASLRGDIAALSILGSSIYLETHEWREFYPRLLRAASANTHWATLVLYDVPAGEEILDLRRPLSEPRRAVLVGGAHLEELKRKTGPFIGNVVADGEPLIFIYLPISMHGQLAYVMAVGIHPQRFQDILSAQAPTESISAVVDRRGNFIARTVDYRHRVGKPATHFVSEAMRKSSSGLYPGTTYEGVKNYTAFYTSAWTGWSAHLAIRSSQIDAPRSWSFIVIVVAGVGSILLGTLLAVLVLRDMAERRRSEEALRQSQKMEAVGQLTGGIAHDFNNLLTAIIGNLDLIHSRATGQERLQRLAGNAIEAARRGAKLTSQLLAFSRTQRMQVRTVDLDKLIRGMSSLLAQSVGPSIEIRVELAMDARIVLSDPNQLELAILNLAVNARDAMPQGGTFTIVSVISRRHPLPQLHNEPCVVLSVSDTGVGMSDEVRIRATEPFFTTKAVGQGTGLGLAQVYGIVRESGGALDIVSTPGIGTTVHIYLPRSDLAASTTTEYPKPLTSVGASNKDAAILVVDDDPQVRSFLVDALREHGYRVTEAPNGEAALGAITAQAFDLLIVDFAMPQMNGAEVARAATLRQPGLRILMVSGYSDSAAIEGILENVQLLTKPFTAVDLISAAREILSGQRTGAKT